MKQLLIIILFYGLAAAAQAASFTIDGVSYTGDCVSSKADDAGVVALQCMGRPAATTTAASAPAVTPAPATVAMRGGRVVDATGALWTISASKQTLRNGAHANRGYGHEYLLLNKTVYVRGTDNRWWYRWAGSADGVWVRHSEAEPT